MSRQGIGRFNNVLSNIDRTVLTDNIGRFVTNTTISPSSSTVTEAFAVASAADIGVTDGTWVDQGSEIDCRGYSTLGIYIDLTVNDSTGNQIQVLSKHTSAGTGEYVLETSSDYQKTMGDSNISIVYFFDVSAIPYVQLQTQATDVDTGGGTIGTVTINIIKQV